MAELERYPTPEPVRDNDLHIRTVSVATVERSYWSPTQQPRGQEVPLLIALHGLGMTGNHMARWSALALRAPQFGVHVIFPDALERCWDDHGSGRRDDGDDDLFIKLLVEHLRRRGEVSEAPVFLAGVGNGASFAEHLARAAVVDVSGIALVSGTATVASRGQVPVPAQPASVLIIHGTKDRGAPAVDTRGRAVARRHASARVRRSLLDTRGHAAVPVQAIKADWETANAGSDRTVIVRQLQGAGPGWPGGGGPLRKQLSGRLPRGLDATAVVLEFARAALGSTP